MPNSTAVRRASVIAGPSAYIVQLQLADGTTVEFDSFPFSGSAASMHVAQGRADAVAQLVNAGHGIVGAAGSIVAGMFTPRVQP